MKLTRQSIVRYIDRQLRNGLDRWGLIILLILVLILVPIFAVLFQTSFSPGPTWQHLVDTVLFDYISNSLLLVLGVGFLTILIGLSTAWVVSTCDFPGRKWFAVGLMLPLAMPTYIAAYTYVGIFDYTGPVQVFLRDTLGLSIEPGLLNIMHLPGLTVVMALVLYPYVFAIARTGFMNQSRTLVESSNVLGSSAWRTFFRVALPNNRPAIVGGVSLVIMEVLNDYGAVHYFGISTFTTGIFRAWFSMGDVQAAAHLSGILMGFVFLLIALERLQRGRARYDSGRQTSRPPYLYQLSGPQKVLAFLVCLVPFLLGFALPVLQLISWSFDTAYKVVDMAFWNLVGNSFVLAVAASLLCVAVSTLLIYAVRVNQTRLFRNLSRLAVLGYSIPGAVIAVGVLVPLLFIDKTIILQIGQYFNSNPGLVLTSSVTALLYAYVVRFLAVAYNSIEGGFQQIGTSLDEGSRMLGVGPAYTFFRVNLPLIKRALLSAGLLVFVDVLKELPLTLILRPFDFNTLATKTFQLAGDELVAQSANSALIIVLTGLVPIILLNRLIAKD